MLHTHPPIKQKDVGMVPCLLTKVVNFDTSGVGSGVNWFQIRASSSKPVLVEMWAEVITAFDAGTTNVLTAGVDTSSAYNSILGSSDITEGTAGFYPASNAKKMVRYAANTMIGYKYTQSGTAATAGQARLYARITPLF